MILLDTDHLSVFTDERDSRHELLNGRMAAAVEQVACTIVSIEELLRGWLAIINRLREAYRQIPAYARLAAIGISCPLTSVRQTSLHACDDSVFESAPWISRSLPLPWLTMRCSSRPTCVIFRRSQQRCENWLQP
jgi:hypothetical protein